jgi:hypothetical protein
MAAFCKPFFAIWSRKALKIEGAGRNPGAFLFQVSFFVIVAHPFVTFYLRAIDVIFRFASRQD